jgi:carnitine-CoA ligase
MVDRFSASRFWDQVRAAGATRIHYLGGILQMLLRQPPRPDDRDHRARIAWGGGCPAAVWGPFEERFGVQIRENYGMTECSSLTTMNLGGPRGSAGRPCPWFEVEIRDPRGAALATGERGEIVVRGREPGLLMPGYFRNPEATAAALRDGWMHTGDLGWFDADGYLYFGGRLKDSIRRRGENVSAWEIERVVEALEWVEESAAIGVPDDLGDEEIKLFVRVADGAAPDPGALLAWCESRLARFQIPRYLAFVEAFEKTGTQRIRKETLPRGTDGCWTREPDGSLRPPRR